MNPATIVLRLLGVNSDHSLQLIPWVRRFVGRSSTVLTGIIARPTVKHFPQMLVAGFALLLPASSAWAAATVTGGAGDLSTSTSIGVFPNLFCACNQSATIEFPPSSSEPSGTNLDCQSCSHTSGTPPDTLTFTVGPAHVDAAYTGDKHSLTFTTHGNASGSSRLPSFISVRSASSGSIGFTVSDQPTPVFITISFSLSGPDSSSSGFVALGKNGATIATMSVDNTGQTIGSISGGTFDPGSYELDIEAHGSGMGCNYSVTATVAAGVAPADIHWQNPAGGNWDDSANWNPKQAPTSIDTATFDLSSLLGLIRVSAPNDAVANMTVDGMLLELANSSLQVLQGDNNGNGLLVKNGGQLLLHGASTLLTRNGLVGFSPTAPGSSVTVSGAGTRWTIGTANPLSVFDTSKVVIDQAALLDAQKEIDLGFSIIPTPGIMEVHTNALVTTPALKVAGSGGSSTLTIDSGGAVQVNQGAATALTVGDSSGRSGLITISGVSADGIHPSSLTVSGSGLGTLIAGDGATRVEVKDGGFFKDTSGIPLFIGDGLTTGKLHVHGVIGSHNAFCLTGAGIKIGSRVVPSEIVVEDSGIVTSGGPMSVGFDSDDLAAVSVTSSGLLDVGDVLQVGGYGQGELTIGGVIGLSGARVVSLGGAVGVVPSLPGTGSGTVTINGSSLSSSEWHVSGDCLVGSLAVGEIHLRGSSSGAGATLTVDGTLTVDALGRVDGNGKLVTGHRVINAGFIDPGFSPGIIEIDGDYEQRATGVLNIQVAGLNPGQFDILKVNGNAKLAGRVQLSFIDGFIPKPGDHVDFLPVSGSTTGALNVVTTVVPANASNSTPAMIIEAAWGMSTNGVGALTVTDVIPTVQLNVAIQPLPGDQGRNVTLTFVPIPGRNHFVEYSDSLTGNSTWQPLPNSPQNSGVVTDTTTTKMRFYRVRIGN